MKLIIKFILLFSLMMHHIVADTQTIERVGFSAVSSGNNDFQPVAGAPFGASLAGAGGSLEISSEYGKGVYLESTLSIAELTPDNKICVYPNPTSDFVIVDLPETEKGTKCEVSDSEGKVVLKQDILSKSEQMNLTALATGVYFLKIILPSNEIEIFQIIKSK